MKTVSLILCSMLVLTACSDAPPSTEPPVEEPELDPDLDGDGDHLTNAEEAELGTDPDDPDTDGDRYLDGDEVLEGTDPTDAESVIYTGGWPYQRDKDQIADPGFDGQPEVGAILPRLVGVDQHGDMVDIYDYALHGKPVVLDLSAGWCAACQEVSLWLEGEGPLGDGRYDSIPDRVKNGEIYWVTILFETAASVPPNADDVAAWYTQYPNDDVAIVADDDRALSDWLWPGAYPAIFVLNEDMTLQVYDRFDYTPALEALADPP
jgi:hypothetical protein